MFPTPLKEYYPIGSRRSDDYGSMGSWARTMRVVLKKRFLAQTLREEAYKGERFRDIAVETIN